MAGGEGKQVRLLLSCTPGVNALFSATPVNKGVSPELNSKRKESSQVRARILCHCRPLVNPETYYGAKRCAPGALQMGWAGTRSPSRG